MKQITLLFIACVLGSMAAHAQTIDDYITEQRGDTLVVKDFIASNSVASALGNLVEIDTLAPAGRVYLLVNDGLYYHTRNIAVTNDRPLTIIGEDSTPHVLNKSTVYPPTIIGTIEGDANQNGGFIGYTTNTTVKNIIGGAHSTNQTQGWTYFDAGASGISLTLDNIYMEHTNWVFIQSNSYPDNSVKISNSYFVNMNGNGCRRNGGVYDNVSNPTDTMWVENSTHIMGAGMLYKFRNFPGKKLVFNHNTFVNISNAVFETVGYQIDWTVTNNLFVNTNAQAYYPGLDLGETDQDLLPTGIINVDTLKGVNNFITEEYLPEEYTSVDASQWPSLRKILVDKNAVYWSPELANIVSLTEAEHAAILDTLAGGAAANGLMASTITMNSRTKDMFDDDATYPYLTNGTWLQSDVAPDFAEDLGMLDANAALGDFIDFTVASLPDANALVMTDMRTEGNSDPEDFAFSDWPIPVDLSFTSQDYMTAALGDMPVGDLNWFPEKKAMWDRDAEYAAIETALNSGTPLSTSIEDVTEAPTGIKLNQNYPNPFNPSTNISFVLPASQQVSLKVYDMLGREVATLINNKVVAGGQQNFTFDASSLSSGVYLYVLQGENFTQSKRMTLIK